MRFEWDERKSEDTLWRRGFDFAEAALVFGGPTVHREDRRRDYGERRVIAVGMVGRTCLTVVYTDRTDSGGLTRRIISARHSSRRERRAYEEETRHPNA